MPEINMTPTARDRELANRLEGIFMTHRRPVSKAIELLLAYRHEAYEEAAKLSPKRPKAHVMGYSTGDPEWQGYCEGFADGLAEFSRAVRVLMEEKFDA